MLVSGTSYTNRDIIAVLATLIVLSGTSYTNRDIRAVPATLRL
jgi:hypothetical protein